MTPADGAPNESKETTMKERIHNANAPRHVRGITGVTLVAVFVVVAAIAEPSFLGKSHLDLAPGAAAVAHDASTYTATADYFPSHYPAPTERAEPMPTF
jgi:hypothetical protein